MSLREAASKHPNMGQHRSVILPTQKKKKKIRNRRENWPWKHRLDDKRTYSDIMADLSKIIRLLIRSERNKTHQLIVVRKLTRFLGVFRGKQNKQR